MKCSTLLLNIIYAIQQKSITFNCDIRATVFKTGYIFVIKIIDLLSYDYAPDCDH